jgi:hypothetical protein
MNTTLRLLLLFISASLVFFCNTCNKCYGDIIISYYNFEATEPQGYSGPLLSCDVIALQDGTPILLTTNNTKIVQAGTAVVTNITIESPQSDRRQTIH